MSTRAVIAVGNRRKWMGVYHHNSGYPSWLGVEVFELAKKIGKAGFKLLLMEHANGISDLSSKLGYRLVVPMVYKNRLNSIWIEWLYVVDDEILHVKCCYCKKWLDISFSATVEEFKELVKGLCEHAWD
jgi:hypothetical protein